MYVRTGCSERRVLAGILAVLLGASCYGPVEPNQILRVFDVAVGASHSCAVGADSLVYCWGRGVEGQLGAGNTYNAPMAVAAVDPGPFVDVAAGDYHTCALHVDGRAFCWGSNDLGQLGSAGGDSNRPRPVDGSWQFVAIVAGSYHSCGLAADGRAACWGANHMHQTGTNLDLPVVQQPRLVQGGFRFASLSGGGSHSCGVTVQGAWGVCWGGNYVGQLGTGDLETARTPVYVATQMRWRVLDAGFRHTCGIDGNGRGRCWGENAYGELGNSAPYDPLLAGATRPATVSGDFVFLDIAAGRSVTCAVRNSGQGMCWGRGEFGNLGNGFTGNHAYPQLITLVPGPRHRFDYLLFDAMAGGGATHTCGLSEFATVYCWGTGNDGQLGNPGATFTTQPVPVRVRRQGD